MEGDYLEDLGANGWLIGLIRVSITVTLYAQNLRHSVRLRQTSPSY